MPSTESFNWLHLTDLHYGQSGQRPLWPNVRQAFFDDLKRLHDRCGPWQAVLFTGDLVQSGGKDELEQMETEVLGRLLKKLAALGSGDAVLLAVPGNHDLTRPDTKKPTAAIRQLLRPGGFAEVEEEIWAELDGEYGQVIISAFANYSAWWNKAPFRPSTSIAQGLLPGDFAATLDIGSRRVGIVGLNTTFLQLAGGDYTGRLAWDLRQLQAVCGGDAVDWLAGHDACLLLTHQGPEWLDERSRKTYPEINPAGRFAAHLFGHMHETVVRSLSQGGGKPLRQWQGCSLFGLEKFGDPPRHDRRHGYGAGRLDFASDGVTIRFWPRRAARDGNGWRFVPDHESSVLVEDEGTAPEQVASQLAPRAPGRRTTASAPATRPAEAVLLTAYVRAARDLWDIIDLAGLPEDERHLAMQRFVLRQLYVPLRMTVERKLKDESFTALEERREQLRLAAAGRGSASFGTEEAIKRESLGDWLDSVISARRPRKRSKKSKTEQLSTSPTPRLVILGDPGGGKTTLLRWLATACLLRREGSPDLERLPDAKTLPAVDWLPILVRCRELAKASVGQSTLEDLLRQTLSKMELSGQQAVALVAVLRDLLEKGRAVLLVDGLDEITDPGARAAFCERLEAVAKRFPAAPMVATSRLVGYREMSRRLGQGFAHSTLSELLPEEKDDFVGRWCEVTITDPGRREAEAEKLRRGIHGSDRIERLTTNPMLLTTMALVQRKVGKLPTRRHKLYWEAVNVLLNWRGEVDEPMDPDEVLPQLEYLAYAMCDQGVQRLRRDEVLDLLEGVRRDYLNIRPVHQRSPEELLAQLERRTGLLVEVGEVEHAGRPVPVYEFRHLTFQEYLAALALVDGRFPGHRPGTTLAERVRPLAGRVSEIHTEIAESELLVTENWREALRLCVASCNDDDVDPVLRAILEPERSEEARPRAILTLLCLADEPNASQAVAESIFRCFAEQVVVRDELAASAGYRAAMDAAAGIWAEPLRTALVREFLRRGPQERAYPGILAGMIATAVLGEGKDESGRWMKRHVATLSVLDDLEVAGASLAIMFAAYEHKAVMVPSLVDSLVALVGRRTAVSHAAAWALVWLTGWRRDAGIWKPRSSKIRPLLPVMADPDADPGVLRWLAYLMGEARFDEALDACVRLLRHPHVETRRAATEAIGQIGAPAGVAGLREALKDVDEKVRRLSLGVLARTSKDNINAALLSRDLDKSEPWLDPQEPISLERVRATSLEFSLGETEVRQRYERLADDFGLRLEWRQ